MNRPTRLSNFFKMVIGIAVEILATLVLMAVVFGVGFLILRWFSR